jgi:hypothetical protein
VHVNKTESPAHESVAFDEEQDLVVIRLWRRGQGVQQRDDFFSVSQVPARELPDHERMDHNLFQIEKLREELRGNSQVVDPNRSVDQDHDANLRLGMGRACFSVPPSAANRWALFRATSDSSPIRTNAVFSLTPVRWAARFRMSSSILSVVLMHICMPFLSASVKRPTPQISLSRASRR